MMPIAVLATMTKPNSESWIGATTSMITHSVPMRPLNQVNVLARTMSARLRLRASGAALAWPRATRSATSPEVRPTTGSVATTVTAAGRPAGAG